MDGKDAVINVIFGKCMTAFNGKDDPVAIRPALENAAYLNIQSAFTRHPGTTGSASASCPAR